MAYLGLYFSLMVCILTSFFLGRILCSLWLSLYDMVFIDLWITLCRCLLLDLFLSLYTEIYACSFYPWISLSLLANYLWWVSMLLFLWGYSCAYFWRVLDSWLKSAELTLFLCLNLDYSSKHYFSTYSFFNDCYN